MDRGYNIYAPQGFHTLMEHNPSASDYFYSLPEDVQDRLLRKARAIDSEDSLRAQARACMESR